MGFNHTEALIFPFPVFEKTGIFAGIVQAYTNGATMEMNMTTTDTCRYSEAEGAACQTSGIQDTLASGAGTQDGKKTRERS
jgi:hypothetical protein